MPLRTLCVSLLLLGGCSTSQFGERGTERFTDKEFSVYAGVKFTREGEVSRWTLINPPAVVEHRPLLAWKDHQSAAQAALAARAGQGAPEAVKTDEDGDNKFTVTAAVWPGDVQRKAIMIVAEPTAKGGGFLVTCEGQANAIAPHLFGAYCKDLMRPVVRLARGR